MLTKIKIQKVLEILESENGNIGTALEFVNPFQLLISTILAAQSTDVQVNKITGPIYKEYPDAHAFLKLSQDEIEQKIKSIGLYRNKAKNIFATVRVLVEQYNGRVPDTRQELVKLPGVGRKTANVVMSVAYGKAAIAVDTHVFRVSNRIGLAAAKNVEQTEAQLMKNIPENQWADAHHWLIWHGRNICKAQNPKCESCGISEYCEFFKKSK